MTLTVICRDARVYRRLFQRRDATRPGLFSTAGWACGLALAVLAVGSVGCGANKDAAPDAVNPGSPEQQLNASPVDPAAAFESSPPAASAPVDSQLAGDAATGGVMEDSASPMIAAQPAAEFRDATGRGAGASANIVPSLVDDAPATDIPLDPDPGAQGADDSPPGLDAVPPAELPTYAVENPVEKAAAAAFSPPAGMKRLTPESNLWIDSKGSRLVVDGFVALIQGPLEMFACPVGTKEHESIVAVLAQSREVHAGLLAIGADSGTPVSFSPEYRPATGQRIAIWVLWRDDQREIHKTPAQDWVKNLRTEKKMDLDWVFAGSSFWKDPESGREFYQADSGDLVCVSNFSTATLDLPIESSQSNGDLQFIANTDVIPPRGTPVRLVFVPIPIPDEKPAEGSVDPANPPEDALLTPANASE
jgi:hypothetical protein